MITYVSQLLNGVTIKAKGFDNSMNIALYQVDKLKT